MTQYRIVQYENETCIYDILNINEKDLNFFINDSNELIKSGIIIKYIVEKI